MHAYIYLSQFTGQTFASRVPSLNLAVQEDLDPSCEHYGNPSSFGWLDLLLLQLETDLAHILNLMVAFCCIFICTNLSLGLLSLHRTNPLFQSAELSIELYLPSILIEHQDTNICYRILCICIFNCFSLQVYLLFHRLFCIFFHQNWV